MNVRFGSVFEQSSRHSERTTPGRVRQPAEAMRDAQSYIAVQNLTGSFPDTCELIAAAGKHHPPTRRARYRHRCGA